MNEKPLLIDTKGKTLETNEKRKQRKLEMKARSEEFVKAVKYQEEKFNCLILSYHQLTGDRISSGWLGQALPVKEEK